MENGQNGHGRRLAVVTGASSGIGFELARVFAEEGFDLLIAAEDAELEPACRELNQMTAGVEAARLDLARPEGVERLYERIRAGARPVDALALNAGIGAGGAFATETELADEPELIDYDALMADKERVVAGAFKNRAQVAAGRVIPDRVKAEMHRKMAEPGSAKED